ncbi:hypothetical protein VYU27_008868 [Nannochloropsis oceanica]
MKLTVSSVLLAGVALLSAMSAVSGSGHVQTGAKSVLVKKGRIVTVTQRFVAQSFNVGRRLVDVQEPVMAGLTTDPEGEFDFGFGPFSSTNKTKRNKTAKSKTDKWADDVGITIKSAKILPNTWKPKVSANMTSTVDGDYAIFELPQDGLDLNREYKIVYKVRVGRGIPSGTFIELPYNFDGISFGDDFAVTVIVK